MTDKLKPLDLSTLLRYAFLSGRGLSDNDKLSDADQKAWSEFDPSEMKCFQRIEKALTPQPVSELVRYEISLRYGTSHMAAQLVHANNGHYVLFDQAEAREAYLLRQLAMQQGEIASLANSLDGSEHCRKELEAKLETANALVTCCCGDPVDKHGMGSGHSPVDMYHHQLMKLEEQVYHDRELGITWKQICEQFESECASWQKRAEKLAAALEQAANNFDHIFCIPRVTMVSSTVQQFDIVETMADGFATDARNALKDAKE